MSGLPVFFLPVETQSSSGKFAQTSETNLAKVGVVGSNPIARSNFLPASSRDYGSRAASSGFRSSAEFPHNLFCCCSLGKDPNGF